MNIFLNRDGSCQKVTPHRIYQGSANVSTITVIAPFDTQSALSIAFSLPNGTRTTYQGMSFSPSNQAGASDGIFFWTYKIPFAVTEYAGTVGVSINVVSATNNQTSYLCTFEVEESIVPTVPAEPDNDTWDALLVLYQQNAAAIAAFADGKVPIGNVTIETLPTGENADVSVAWDETDSEIDFSFKIPQGPQGVDGAQGIQGEQGLQGIQGIQGETGTSIRFKGNWVDNIDYVNNSEFIDCVTVGGALYLCLQTHTSQGGQPPKDLPQLWKLSANGVQSVSANGGVITVTFADSTTSTITIEGDVVETTGIGIDKIPTENSTNLVESGGVYNSLPQLLWSGFWDGTNSLNVDLKNYKMFLLHRDLPDGGLNPDLQTILGFKAHTTELSDYISCNGLYLFGNGTVVTDFISFNYVSNEKMLYFTTSKRVKHYPSNSHSEVTTLGLEIIAIYGIM